MNAFVLIDACRITPVVKLFYLNANHFDINENKWYTLNIRKEPLMTNKLYRNPTQYDWTAFQNRLRSLMENNGLNMSSLAELTGISVTSISRYFTGRVPDTTAMWMLADAFNVSIDWLCGRAPSKYDNLSDEQHELITKYTKASPSDKKIVNLFLSKYDEE